jgi:hypothetical protein
LLALQKSGLSNKALWEQNMDELSMSDGEDDKDTSSNGNAFHIA